MCRQRAPGTRELKISSVLGEETHTEVQRCEESNQGFQGARACVAKGLRPPNLNNRPEDKNPKKGFRSSPFYVAATAVPETDSF